MGCTGLKLEGAIVENKALSLTEEIYAELVDGLKTGSLDWTAFIAKYSASKGPLYNAIGDSFTIWNPKLRPSVKSKLTWTRLD